MFSEILLSKGKYFQNSHASFGGSECKGVKNVERLQCERKRVVDILSWLSLNEYLNFTDSIELRCTNVPWTFEAA